MADRPVGNTPATAYVEAALALVRGALVALDTSEGGPPMARVGDREALWLVGDLLRDRLPFETPGMLDPSRVSGVTPLRVIDGGGTRDDW